MIPAFALPHANGHAHGPLHLQRAPLATWPPARWQTASAPPTVHPAHDADSDFVHLQKAYRGHGGLERGEALAARTAWRGGYVQLARELVQGRVFSLQWNGSFWLPMMQFETEHMTLREGPRRVLEELHGVMDGWRLAQWYVAPNTWLADQRPLDLLATQLCAVLQAARADRFVADA